jgi:hypothetical protein
MAQDSAKDETQVWNLEKAYWEYVRANDPASKTVTHHVRGASYPNWIDTDQLRQFKFEGSRLLLSSPPIVSGGESLKYVLTWERIS